jgi:calcineurin-like phosphoesterase family protein
MQQDSRIFLISDKHLWHDNIKRYCNRPDDYVERITKNWDDRIRPQDIIVDLGDSSFQFKRFAEWLQQRPGKKIKVMGNHDHESYFWHMRNGYAFACDSFTMYNIVFSHRPLDPLEMPVNHLNVHGHTHNLYHRMYDEYHWAYSPELENYMPIPVDTVLGDWARFKSGRMKIAVPADAQMPPTPPQSPQDE